MMTGFVEIKKRKYNSTHVVRLNVHFMVNGADGLIAINCVVEFDQENVYAQMALLNVILNT